MLEWVSVAPYTSWRIGGRVKYFLEPKSLMEFKESMLRLPECPTMMLGLGSNVLFADGDINLAVILSRSFLTGMEKVGPGVWQVEAGVSCAKLARVAACAGYRDAAFFCGIPGTLGGALRMNAGAFKGETWAHVDWVEMLTLQGEVVRFYAKDFIVSYRHVIAPIQGYYLKAQLSFADLQPESQQAMIALWLAERAKTQPIGLPSCGSVFRNPYPQYAGALIESCGLKGYRIGDAEVSNKHANFIVNAGQAKAQDVLELMKHIRSTVMQVHGISLVSEVIFVGEDGIAQG